MAETQLEQKRNRMEKDFVLLRAAGHAVKMYETVDASNKLVDVQGYHYASCTQCLKGSQAPFPSPFEHHTVDPSLRAESVNARPAGPGISV